MGAVWRLLGGLLGSSWGFSEASWILLGASSGRRIELSVRVSLLGLSWGCLGAILGCHGRLLGRFGALLGRLGILLGCLGAVVGAPEAVLERRKLEKAIT